MKENQGQYPYIPDAVITYLQKQFPNHTPMSEYSMFTYGRFAGHQDIIQHLQQVKQWSEENNV